MAVLTTTTVAPGATAIDYEPGAWIEVASATTADLLVRLMFPLMGVHHVIRAVSAPSHASWHQVHPNEIVEDTLPAGLKLFVRTETGGPSVGRIHVETREAA